jgi:hypothetical protein
MSQPLKIVAHIQPNQYYYLEFYINLASRAYSDIPPILQALILEDINQTEGKAMSNRSIIIMVLVLISATAYLLIKGDGDIDMGGEKHGAEAAHMESAKKDAPAAPVAPAAAPAPAPAPEAKK